MAKQSPADSNKPSVHTDTVAATLDDHGYEGRYRTVRNVPIKTITQHPKSQSRLATTERSQVNKLIDVIKNGAVLPPGLVAEEPDGTFELLDGNTRLLAQKALDRTHVDIVALAGPLSQDEKAYLSAILNADSRGPVPLNREEKRLAVIHAVRLPEGKRPSDESLARDFHLSKDTVRGIRVAEEIKARLKAQGEDLVDSQGQPVPVADSVLGRLNSIKDDRVLVETARLVVDAKVPQTELGKIVTEINSKNSEESRLEVVRGEVRNRAEIIRRRRHGLKATPVPQIESRRVLGQLLSYISKYSDIDLWVPGYAGTLEEWTPKVQQASEFLAKLAVKYQANLEKARVDIQSELAAEVDSVLEDDAAVVEFTSAPSAPEGSVAVA